MPHYLDNPHHCELAVIAPALAPCRFQLRAGDTDEFSIRASGAYRLDQTASQTIPGRLPDYDSNPRHSAL